MAKRMTPPQVKEADRMKTEGYTVAAIAEKLGVDRHTVSRHLDLAAGVNSDRAPAGFSADEVLRLRLLTRAFNFFPCASCGTTVAALKTVATTSCAHCGVAYTRNMPSGSQRDAA